LRVHVVRIGIKSGMRVARAKMEPEREKRVAKVTRVVLIAEMAVAVAVVVPSTDVRMSVEVTMPRHTHRRSGTGYDR